MPVAWSLLTFAPPPEALQELNASWGWLLHEPFKPVLFSSLGDVFIEPDSGGVWWLNTGTAELTRVADSVAHFSLSAVRRIVRPHSDCLDVVGLGRHGVPLSSRPQETDPNPGISCCLDSHRASLRSTRCGRCIPVVVKSASMARRCGTMGGFVRLGRCFVSDSYGGGTHAVCDGKPSSSIGGTEALKPM